VHTPALFDTRTVPTEAMDWLASWVGVTLDLSWGEQKRRLFLAHLRKYSASAGRGRSRARHPAHA